MFSYITSMREMLISFKKTLEICKQYLPSIESVCSCGSNILRSEFFFGKSTRFSHLFFFSAFETGIGIVTEVTGVEGVVSGSTTCSEISFPTPTCG